MGPDAPVELAQLVLAVAREAPPRETLDEGLIVAQCETYDNWDPEADENDASGSRVQSHPRGDAVRKPSSGRIERRRARQAAAESGRRADQRPVPEQLRLSARPSARRFPLH